MAKTQYLEYQIHLTDAALVAELQARYPNGVIRAPYDPGPPEGGAAVEFAQAAGVYPPALPVIASGDTWVDPPFITSPWFSMNYPRDVATFTRKSGGFLGIGGSTTKFYWVGTFVYAPAADAPPPGSEDPAPPGPPMRVRWIDSALMFKAGNERVGKDSGRSADGMGRAIRDTGFAVATHTVTENIPGLQPYATWERLYARPRRFGSGSARFWGCQMASGQSGFDVDLMPTGQIAIYGKNSSGTRALAAVATGEALELERLYKIDVLLSATVPVSNNSTGTLRVFVNGQEVATATAAFSGTGMWHTFSFIGPVSGAGDLLGLEVDVCDWHQAEHPFILDSGAARPAGALGHDWLYGTHIQHVRVTGFVSNVGWTGDWRLLLQHQIDEQSTGNAAQLAAAGAATLEVTTDVADAVAGSMGAIAAEVSLYAGGFLGASQLGYAVNGGAAVTGAVNNTTAFGWTSFLYRPALGAPETIDSLSLRYVSGGAVNVRSLLAGVLLVGVFGPEDIPPGIADPPAAPSPQKGVHNAPYPRSSWATSSVAPLSPVIIQSGTYVGNGTFFDLALRAPCHWLWVRPLTGTGLQGFRWWSSMQGPHLSSNSRPVSGALPRATMNPSYVAGAGDEDQQVQALLRFAGAMPEANAAGVTYQYIAVCDPGARFLLNGTFIRPTAASGQATPLANPDFTPEALLFWWEGLTSGALTGDRLYYKGPGHLGSFASPVGGAVGGAEQNNTISYGQGQITPWTNICSNASPVAYAAWRRNDGSNDPGVNRVVQVTSYVGNGSSTRSIYLGSPSGRRPLFALVIPHNTSTPHYRDPSNTGTTSQTLAGTANPSTAIIGGGIDEIQVGSSLNVNAVVYDVFVIPGSDVAGNGGWSGNGEFVPVETDSPSDGDYPLEPVDPDTIPPPEEPPPASPDPGDLTTDIAATCVAASTRLCNLGLSRIGITDAITNLATEASRNAETARLHYKTEIDAVLRAHPWKFATRYATLTLVGGTTITPVNDDWQYSYRLPADCVKVRRIVRPGYKRRFDPCPPAFDVTEDGIGGLLYADERTDAAAGLEVAIEYTARPTCPAGINDPIFRSACAWRLAHAFAAPLGRDTKQQQFCYAMFKQQIGEAEVAGQNEQQPQNPEHVGEAEWLRERN